VTWLGTAWAVIGDVIPLLHCVFFLCLCSKRRYVSFIVNPRRFLVVLNCNNIRTAVVTSVLKRNGKCRILGTAIGTLDWDLTASGVDSQKHREPGPI
jgi:hypothetical protein